MRRQRLGNKFNCMVGARRVQARQAVTGRRLNPPPRLTREWTSPDEPYSPGLFHRQKSRCTGTCVLCTKADSYVCRRLDFQYWSDSAQCTLTACRLSILRENHRLQIGGARAKLGIMKKLKKGRGNAPSSN